VSARTRWIALAAILLFWLAPGTALAHANLDRADPLPGAQLDQPPRQLQLFFSEAVDGSFSRVQPLNAERESVDRGDSHVAPTDPRSLIVSLPDQLPNGVYTVAWRTLSAVDGHSVDGAYPLIVGPMPAEGVRLAAHEVPAALGGDAESGAGDRDLAGRGDVLRARRHAPQDRVDAGEQLCVQERPRDEVGRAREAGSRDRRCAPDCAEGSGNRGGADRAHGGPVGG